jgi:hypothetical protein
MMKAAAATLIAISRDEVSAPPRFAARSTLGFLAAALAWALGIGVRGEAGVGLHGHGAELEVAMSKVSWPGELMSPTAPSEGTRDQEITACFDTRRSRPMIFRLGTDWFRQPAYAQCGVLDQEAAGASAEWTSRPPPTPNRSTEHWDSTTTPTLH